MNVFSFANCFDLGFIYYLYSNVRRLEFHGHYGILL